MDRLQELLALERSGWQSLCDGTGSAFYENLMTDDALMLLADGMTMTRDEVADALRYAPPGPRSRSMTRASCRSLQMLRSWHTSVPVIAAREMP